MKLIGRSIIFLSCRLSPYRLTQWWLDVDRDIAKLNQDELQLCFESQYEKP